MPVMTVEEVIFVPPLGAVYHPSKLKLVFVASGSVPIAAPFVTDEVAVPQLPPFVVASHVTVQTVGSGAPPSQVLETAPAVVTVSVAPAPQVAFVTAVLASARPEAVTV